MLVVTTLGRTIFYCAVFAALAGCGSGTPSAGPTTGRVAITIAWPSRQARLIPVASNSIVVSLDRGNAAITSKVVARPTNGGPQEFSFVDIPAGLANLRATAFPQPDGSGVPQAAASTPISIVAGETASIGLSLQSTIDHLDLRLAAPSLFPGQSRQMELSAKDAAGNLVLTTPAKVTWKVTDTSVASITSSGLLSGVAPGTTQISATDTESDSTGTVSVSVSPASSGPDWPMFRGDAQNRGRSTGRGAHGEMRWRISVANVCPLVLGTEGTLWTANTAYLMPGFNPYARVRGYDRAGALRAESPSMLSDQASGGAAVAPDGTAYFSIKDSSRIPNTPAGSPSGIYASDLSRGLYSQAGADFGYPTFAADGSMYVMAGNRLAAARDGLKWTFVPVDGWQDSTVGVGPDGTVYLPAAGVWALDGATGSEKWRNTEVGRTAAPVIGDEGAVFLAGKQLFALNAATGAMIWKTSNADYHNTIALGWNHYLYANAGDRLRALDQHTGAIVWEFVPNTSLQMSPAVGGDNTVYVIGGNQRIYAVDGATGAEKWELALPATDHYYPREIAIGSDGTIYVCIADVVYAIM